MAAGDGHGFWFALGGAVAFVFAREGKKRGLWRFAAALIAGALGYGFAVADVFQTQNRALVAAVVTAFSGPVLETALAIIEDVAFIKDAIRQKWFKK